MLQTAFGALLRRLRLRTTVLIPIALLLGVAPCTVPVSAQHVADGSHMTSTSSTFRTVHVYNDSPVRISVVYAKDDSIASPDGGVHPGGHFPLKTYVGHTFDVYELPDLESGLCRDSESTDEDELEETCWSTTYTITEGIEQEITITDDFEAIVSDTKTLAEQHAQEALGECDNLIHRQDLFLDCLKQNTVDSIHHWNEEWKFNSKAVKRLGSQLDDYICHDTEAEFETSPRIRQFQWESYTAQVLHDRPSSQIHVIEDFIRPEECQAVLKASEPHLERAIVLDGDGNSVAIDMPWEMEPDGHPLTELGRRIFDYTSHVLKLNITEQGQEPMMSIQYSEPNNVTGAEDEDDDDEDGITLDGYEAQCDGTCDGSPYNPSDRIATVIMYCEVPTVGGHTHFRNAGIHVQPKFGTALFFSYVYPRTRMTDTGFTEHSGCPVYQGDKKIATQWIRMGDSGTTKLDRQG